MSSAWSVWYAAGIGVIAVGYYAAAHGGEALLLTRTAGAFWPARLTRGALPEVRALSFELFPDALAQQGRVGALGEEAAALSAREGLALGAEAEEQVHHLGRKALAVIIKQARASIRAAIRVTVEDGRVSMDGCDDGWEFDFAARGGGHCGRRSMHGRVADLCGRLERTRAPRSGSVVHADVPAQP